MANVAVHVATNRGEAIADIHQVLAGTPAEATGNRDWAESRWCFRVRTAAQCAPWYNV